MNSSVIEVKTPFRPNAAKEDSQTKPVNSSTRRHDLDALRAIAMLLGIVLHAALSFAPIPVVGSGFTAKRDISDSVRLYSRVSHAPIFHAEWVLYGDAVAATWTQAALPSSV